MVIHIGGVISSCNNTLISHYIANSFQCEICMLKTNPLTAITAIWGFELFDVITHTAIHQSHQDNFLHILILNVSTSKLIHP